MTLRLFMILLFVFPGVTSLAQSQEWIEEPFSLSSSHPYPNRAQGETQTIQKRGATSIRLWFDLLETEPGWDHLNLQDVSGNVYQELSGYRSGFWSNPVPGDTIFLRFWSDDSISGYGYVISRIAYQTDAPTPPKPSLSKPSLLSKIRLYQIDSGGTLHQIRETNTIQIFTQGSPTRTTFDFLIWGFDSSDRKLRHFPFKPKITFAGSGVFGTLESLDSTTYRFHAGPIPTKNLTVTVQDPQHHQVEARFRVDILEPVVKRPSRPPSLSPPTYVQIGAFTNPEWASRKIAQEPQFPIPTAYQTCNAFQIISEKSIEIEHIQIRFQGQNRSQTIVHGPIQVRAGEPYEFSTPNRSGQRIVRLDVKQRMHRSGRTLLYARAFQRHPVAPQFVQIGTFTNPEWASRKIAQEPHFSIPTAHQNRNTFRIVTDKPIELDRIQAWIAGHSKPLTVIRGPIRIEAGQAYDFSTPNQPGKPIQRIKIMQRMHRTGHTTLHVQVP
ncbi:MAG: hypothetical protein QF752_11480 [Planctomycetota bacterium]|jgi:hypothetical protein|nr:hypothetical protein [Planctomycetota bacterium]